MIYILIEEKGRKVFNKLVFKMDLSLERFDSKSLTRFTLLGSFRDGEFSLECLTAASSLPIGKIQTAPSPVSLYSSRGILNNIK
jgi:hypothetical protein